MDTFLHKSRHQPSVTVLARGANTVWRETFEGENFHGSVEREHFEEKTFAEC